MARKDRSLASQLKATIENNQEFISQLNRLASQKYKEYQDQYKDSEAQFIHDLRIVDDMLERLLFNKVLDRYQSQFPPEFVQKPTYEGWVQTWEAHIRERIKAIKTDPNYSIEYQETHNDYTPASAILFGSYAAIDPSEVPEHLIKEIRWATGDPTPNLAAIRHHMNKTCSPDWPCEDCKQPPVICPKTPPANPQGKTQGAPRYYFCEIYLSYLE